MRLRFRGDEGRRGNALVLTMVLGGVLVFMLSSFLLLVSAQNRSVARSQTWNATVSLMEAGIEEALAHVNHNGLSSLEAAGWRLEQDCLLLRRRLGEGRYTVAIAGTQPPVIECAACLPVALPLPAGSEGAKGRSSVLSDGQKSYILRTARVVLTNGSLFRKAVVTHGAIMANGHDLATDSFDSADPNFSTLGRYDPTKRKDNGDVATNSGETNLFGAGRASIMGRVTTGPGASLEIGTNGSVGALGWVYSGRPGIEPGFLLDDLNLSFPEIPVPFSESSPVQGGPVTETNISFGTGMVTVAVLPVPPPEGRIATNAGPITARQLPVPVPAAGVHSNLVVETSLVFPANPVGPVVTNLLTVTTNDVPHPLPSSVSRIVTNHVQVTNFALPKPLPQGTIATNLVASSSRYPFLPMPEGPPAAPPAWSIPEPGTFLGEVTNRFVEKGRTANRGWHSDYSAIKSYTYTAPSYTLTFANTFTYKALTYTWMAPETFTYAGPTATNVTVTTEPYDLVFDDADYVVNQLVGNLYVRGRARVHVLGNISLNGREGLTIGPQGSLILYMAGERAQIAGRGVVNKSGSARNFLYFGLSSHKALEIGGNGQFIGAIYAPTAALTLGDGGFRAQEFIGAIVAHSVSLKCAFNFHYDEDLDRRGPRGRYTMASWIELGPGESTILSEPAWVFRDDSAEAGGPQNGRD